MNPKNMKQYNNLLWLGVPKNKQDSVRGERSTQYIDPAHICFIQLTTPPWDLESTEVMQYESYEGDHEHRITPIPLSRNYHSVHVSTKYLRDILDNVTADTIEIMVDDDYPIYLHWTDEHDDWKALIAPRIENE